MRNFISLATDLRDDPICERSIWGTLISFVRPVTVLEFIVVIDEALELATVGVAVNTAGTKSMIKTVDRW